MRLDRLWLSDFRNYVAADLAIAPGLTTVVGPNGHGKSNLLEAVGYLATLSSFRGANTDTLIRDDAQRAVVRGEGVHDGRPMAVAAELVRNGPNRARLDGRPLRRPRDLRGTLQTSVFAPDDLALVKDGPSVRRRFLDDTLLALDPSMDATCTAVDRVLRQRNALLRQVKGRLDGDARRTLEIWDAKFVAAGEQLAEAREQRVCELAPILAASYRDLAGADEQTGLRYVAPWQEGGLAAALSAARLEDLRRGVSTVGPHRDELEVLLGGALARTHASQGEQRTLALALRLAVHRLVATVMGEPPILLLDDVFSELDPQRSAALVEHLPPGQCLLSTAAGLPPGVVPELTVTVAHGTIRSG